MKKLRNKVTFKKFLL